MEFSECVTDIMKLEHWLINIVSQATPFAERRVWLVRLVVHNSNGELQH